MLHRELYRGVVVYNRTRKRDAWGLKRQSKRAADEHIRVNAPALRIVSEECWQAAQQRLEAVRGSYLRWSRGKLWGRPAAGVESKCLLTGLAVCAECGGTFYRQSRSHGRQRAHFYACSSYFYRGAAVCGNGLVLPMADADAGVLGAFETQLLDPDAIAVGFREALAALQQPPDHTDEDRLRRELGVRSVDAATVAGIGPYRKSR